MPFEFNAVYTHLWEKNRIVGNPFFIPGTHLLTFTGSLTWSNSAKSSLLKEYDYGTFIHQNTPGTSPSDTSLMGNADAKKVFVGDFKRFVIPALAARYVYFFPKFKKLPQFGLSGSLEKTFGKVNNLNWKLGLPISLKNKEGEAKINFELQWREIQKDHTVGLSVGLPLGNSIF